MKAKIDHNGVLVIEPENETEVFALQQWSFLSVVEMTSVELHEHNFVKGSRVSIAELEIDLHEKELTR